MPHSWKHKRPTVLLSLMPARRFPRLGSSVGEARGQESEIRTDERIEAFLKAVVGLEGNFHAEVREGVRICLADYERKFPDIPRVLYRERVVEEIARQKGNANRTPFAHRARSHRRFRAVSIGG